MEDRRLFTRIETKLPLRFRDLSSNGKEGLAETINISANGLGLITKEDMVIKSFLEIWLYLPDHHEPLRVRGEVVWCLPLGESNLKRIGISLEKEEFMGLARALWARQGVRL